MKVILFIALLIAAAFCAGAGTDYSDQGDNWGDSEAQCNGTGQSPINIITADVVCSTDREISSQAFSTTVQTGNLYFPTRNADAKDTIQQAAEAGEHISKFTATNPSGVELSYTATQYHLHAPSEHTIDGTRYPVELHFVHAVDAKDADDVTFGRNHAVIGLLFEEDQNIADENTIFGKWGVKSVGDLQNTVSNLNFSTIFEDVNATTEEFYSYYGGLTTPPCSEIVNWYLLKTPLKVSTNQKNFLTSTMDVGNGQGNYRNTQPLNGRTVYLGNKNSCASQVEESASILKLSLVVLAALLMLF